MFASYAPRIEVESADPRQRIPSPIMRIETDALNIADARRAAIRRRAS